jgi:signal transduction histidine kinase
LTLGLGLVAVILALMLGGTLRGLWSYYVTINGIRMKLSELTAAEELKAAVADLVAPDSLANLVAAPDKLRERMAIARVRVDDYEERLQETVASGHDSDRGEHESGLIAVLRTELIRLQEAVVSAYQPQALVSGDRGFQSRQQSALAGVVSNLQRAVGDLRDDIKEELDSRLNETRRHYQISLWIILPSSIVGLLIMAGLLGSFYSWIVRPIRDLLAGVQRVARGDFGHRIAVKSGDEMEDLAAAFNDMTGRLSDLYGDLARQVNERSRQLVRSERLASVGFLAAGVAHEINNPLASIAFCSEALESRLAAVLDRLPADDKQTFVKYLRMIQDEAFRCKNITERLLAFSRTGEPKREATDLAALVQSVLDVTQHLQNSKGKQIVFQTNDRLGRVVAPVCAEEIKSVVLNLVVNALDSLDEGGKLTIRLDELDGMAVLAFSDTGCGMNQETLDNIFEPFFTRNRTGKGTGLGLTISHRIVTQHGGEIEAASAGPGQGSTFTVRLPLTVAEDSTPAVLEFRRAA